MNRKRAKKELVLLRNALCGLINVEALDIAIDELNEKRPHGEWEILARSDEGVHAIKCPLCGFFKGGEFCLFTGLPNFCEMCGADMRTKAGEK